MKDFLMNTYQRLPVAFTHGEGVWLWDRDGKRYLDALAGIAVVGLGHAHAAVAKAICEQAERLLHTSNLYRIPLQEEVGALLCQVAGMDRVFFANSGAEANEAALKLARLYGHRTGRSEPCVIVTEGAFHGRTLATLAATANEKAKLGFDPLPSGFFRVPYDDVDAVAKLGEQTTRVVAVLVEPIQGEGGIRLPAPDYLRKLRALCDENDWLLILDEIQTGVGRTGRWLAYQHHDVIPDVVTLAKGLANGVPIGACMARGKAADLFGPGSHGSTFGGNPLACAAARAVVETIEREGLSERAAWMGDYLLAGFRQRLAGLDGVRDIRGKGLMLAVELEKPGAPIVGRALDRGLLVNVTAERTIRLLPPLILQQPQAEQILDSVSAIVAEFLAE